MGLSETGLWLITPSDSQTASTVIEQAYRQAQEAVARVGQDPELLTRARRQAETVLGTFFAATGWKVSVRWQE
jgi:hypothetical protein